MTRVYHVDAFTDRPFSGNPAAVCVLDAPKDETWMQAVAKEMNLSETAFLDPRRGEAGDRDAGAFGLRWFTPAAEVELCGHATLATAHVLWESGLLPAGEIARFRTASGVLTATSGREEIELDFPARPIEKGEAPPGLLEALGAGGACVGRNRNDFLVEVGSENALRALTPDFARLRGLPVRAVMVTSASASDDRDFVSRFFAPAVGVDEDPVTGSAHCCLGPFWGERLGKTEMLAYQASARGGTVRVRLRGGRVVLAGRAVMISEGRLLV